MLILRMLHKNMLVAWESFPPQLTIQLAGHIGEDEYMAFGLSGEQGKSSMKGGDVAVAYMDEYLGHVEDYNLTARFFSMLTILMPLRSQVARHSYWLLREDLN